MALSSKRLHKKREKKRQKCQKRQKSQNGQTMPVMSYQQWPLHEALVYEKLWEEGLGNVIVSRQSAQGAIAMSVFLVDVFCLGITDCFFSLVNPMQYQQALSNLAVTGQTFEKTTPVYATALIRQAKQYAQGLGLSAHSDFNKVSNILTGIDHDLTFTFGKDGKAFFVQGPHDCAQKVDKIIRTLENHIGIDNFDVLLLA